ncbi:MAG TPA: hypothetical protein DCY59_07325 [Micrococcaceae bacterium]|nr:hypothetical protein [Micrococcaceae bacterium]
MDLFDESYEGLTANWIMKAYWDSIYSCGLFVKAACSVSNREGLSVDGAYCRFPDPNGWSEEDLFEGVEFGYGSPGIDLLNMIVSEAACAEVLMEACRRYLVRPPKDQALLQDAMDRIREW